VRALLSFSMKRESERVGLSPPLQPRHHSKPRRLSVRLLEARTGTRTTELLGLAATVVGDEEGTVELDEGLLEQVLGVLVDVLLVVGDEGLGDGLTNGVDLGGVATTGDADADVQVGELVEADNEEGLVDLEAQDLGLNELQRAAVDLDQALTSLGLGDGSGRLLLAEALNTLCRRHDCECLLFAES
jgi:hypothetical protein